MCSLIAPLCASEVCLLIKYAWVTSVRDPSIRRSEMTLTYILLNIHITLVIRVVYTRMLLAFLRSVGPILSRLYFRAYLMSNNSGV